MPRVYRIAKSKYADDSFDGVGAKKYGGRWNSKGVAAVYASESPSLALLELVVHLKDDPKAYTLSSIEVPDSHILTLDLAALPQDWSVDPSPTSTADIGDGWIASAVSVALAVPSSIIPQQNNYLINPAHPDFPQMVKRSLLRTPFPLDPRLLPNNR